MTVLTVGVVGAVVVTGGAAIVATPALAGSATGAGFATVAGVGGAAATATGATVAGSAGAGAVVGSIAGAAAAGAGAGAAGTATAAAVGGAVGAGASAAVTSTSAGFAGLVGGIASGPVGWIVLGTTISNDRPLASQKVTFDCWKPVLHDFSSEPSDGKLISEIIQDPRIKQIVAVEDHHSLPNLSLINIWDEKFDIQYLTLPWNNQVVAHAVQIN